MSNEYKNIKTKYEGKRVVILSANGQSYDYIAHGKCAFIEDNIPVIAHVETKAGWHRTPVDNVVCMDDIIGMSRKPRADLADRELRIIAAVNNGGQKLIEELKMKAINEGMKILQHPTGQKAMIGAFTAKARISAALAVLKGK